LRHYWILSSQKSCFVPPLLQDWLGRILATLFQLINYLPGGGTRRWLRYSTIAARQFGKKLATLLQRINNLPGAEPGGGCTVKPLLQERLGRILTTLLQLTNYLLGGGTWRWLRYSTIAAGQVGINIGNPLATSY
jgi:hypothetical protein